MSYRPGSPYVVGAAMPGQVQANAMAAARFRASLAAGGNMLVVGQQPVVSIASPYPQLQGGIGQPIMQLPSQQRGQIPMAGTIPGQSGVLGQNLILNGTQGMPGAMLMNQMQILGAQPKLGSVVYRPVSHGQQVLSPQVLQGGIRYLAPSSIPQHLAYGSQALGSPVTVASSVKNNLEIVKEMKKRDEEKEAEASSSGDGNQSSSAATVENMDVGNIAVKASEVKVSQYSSPAKIITNTQVDLLTQKAVTTTKVNGLVKVKGRAHCCICGLSEVLPWSKSKLSSGSWGTPKSVVFDSLKKHQCGVCGKGFLKNYSLLLHQRVHHQARRANVSCDSCSKVLPSPCSLQSHKRIIHAPSKATEVRISNLATSSLSTEANGSNKKPKSQKCPRCSRVCRSRRHLRVHMLSHKRRQFKICAGCVKHVRKMMNATSQSK